MFLTETKGNSIKQWKLIGRFHSSLTIFLMRILNILRYSVGHLLSMKRYMIMLTRKPAEVGFAAFSKSKGKPCQLYYINARLNKEFENLWNL